MPDGENNPIAEPSLIKKYAVVVTTPGIATYDNLFASTFAPLYMMIVNVSWNESLSLI